MDFSVIIPHRNSIETLRTLLCSIPQSPEIEIIIADNSPTPITKEEINVDRDYILCYADPSRFAGGARNEGMTYATGKWLVFADADDYFAPGAFDTFYNNIDSTADVIYFCAEGIYSDTKEHSDRGDSYTNMTRGYLNGTVAEDYIRCRFCTPWAKMVRKSLVDEHHITYDEVKANNDDYFALLIGYYAKTIAAVDSIVYIITVTCDSITRKKDFESVKSRYMVTLRLNQFMRQHGLSHNQRSCMLFLSQSLKFGIGPFFSFLKEAINYRQNIFIGLGRWPKTIINVMRKNSSESKYTTK